jgi:hypothetical protein
MTRPLWYSLYLTKIRHMYNTSEAVTDSDPEMPSFIGEIGLFVSRLGWINCLRKADPEHFICMQFPLAELSSGMGKKNQVSHETGLYRSR